MIGRRTLLAALAASGVLGMQRTDAEPSYRDGSARPFDRAWLEAEAQRLSRDAYVLAPLVPEGWRALDYDQYRMIWFDPRKGIWMDEDRPFKVDLFHAGLFFERAIDVNVVEKGIARSLIFDETLFDRTDEFPVLPIDETMGYSGLRLRAALERIDIFTEFAVFQGASYFRAIGTGQTYGLSARGLTIDTARGSGEEFPAFTRFWLEAPDPDDATITVHALLDSDSVVGAYTFRIDPGTVTAMEVEVTLFPRRNLDHVGLAPLTSMFLFNRTNRAVHDDFRPQVHDSDGLLIHNGAGEVILRPLKNPRALEVSSFVDKGPRGFGLVQRARDLGDFEDFEARYHNRPSLWITPHEDWGEGAVQLVEIPTELEVYDNIVAYWRPRNGLSAGGAHRFSYRMDWCEEPSLAADVAAVTRTAIGGNWDRSRTLVAIDFVRHPRLTAEPDRYEKLVRASRGTVSEGVLIRHPETGALRLTFAIEPEAPESSELRAQLFLDGEPVTEVWLYRWTRPA